MNHVNTDCSCPKVECPRHTHCEECREYHGEKGALPFCEREDPGQGNEIKSGA